MKNFKEEVLWFIFASFIVLALTGIKAETAAAEQKGKNEKVLAVIGEEKITLKEFNKIIEELPGQYRSLADRDKERFLEKLVEQKLLLGEARERSLDRDEEVKKKINDITEQVLIHELLSKEIQQKVGVKEEEIKGYYESHKSEFGEPEKIKARHILVDSEKEAKRILKKLNKGADFAAVAKKKSKCPSKDKGGDLGFFDKGRMAKEFEEAAFNLKVGEMSGIVKTQFGWHIIKLEERQAAKVKPYSEASAFIKRVLSAKKQEQLFNVYIQDLKDKNKVIIHKELLKQDISPKKETAS